MFIIWHCEAPVVLVEGCHCSKPGGAVEYVGIGTSRCLIFLNFFIIF